MTRFSSGLAPRLEAFLELKRAMGRRYQAAEMELRRFDRHVAGLGQPVEAVTRDIVHAWLGAKPHVSPVTQQSRAGILRQFCIYLYRLDSRTYVPDRALFPARLPIFKAHIYSEEELRALLRAVPIVVSARFALGRETIHKMVLTLYGTGFRAGEVCRLRIGNVDLAMRTLFVHQTKFFKSRIAPLSESLAGELRSYLEARAAHLPAGTDAPFFVGRCGGAISPGRLSHIFHKLVAVAGIATRPGRRKPRLHDLRHTFAVHRVLRWYREGADVQAKLPLLATYMGHSSPLSTHLYLTASAELLHEAARRFERACGSLVVAPKEIIHA
jgi:integrase